MGLQNCGDPLNLGIRILDVQVFAAALLGARTCTIYVSFKVAYQTLRKRRDLVDSDEGRTRPYMLRYGQRRSIKTPVLTVQA